MKKISLTKGAFAIVDDADFEWLNQWKWHLHSHGYAIRCPKRGVNLRMHRLILEVPDDMQVDHINGNKLDNRRSNLRPCTMSENRRNRGVQSNNKSGYKGVCWHERSKRWMARIGVNNTYIYLGYFKYKEDAAEAYRQACPKYHGEFAKV